MKTPSPSQQEGQRNPQPSNLSASTSVRYWVSWMARVSGWTAAAIYLSNRLPTPHWSELFLTQIRSRGILRCLGVNLQTPRLLGRPLYGISADALQPSALRAAPRGQRTRVPCAPGPPRPGLPTATPAFLQEPASLPRTACSLEVTGAQYTCLLVIQKILRNALERLNLGYKLLCSITYSSSFLTMSMTATPM